MNYIRGFLMAWGYFTRIPCPYKKWKEEDRYAMLNMFPLTGLMAGALLGGVWFCLDWLEAGSLLTGVLLTCMYFFITGYIHLDGFMDCSDALLSRRPDMEERRRILKDSRVGAFAVISLVFMTMIFMASLVSMADGFSFKKAGLITAVLMLSREFSAYDVINKEPMEGSQYAETGKKRSRGMKGIPGMFITYAAVIIIWALFISEAGSGERETLLSLAALAAAAAAERIVSWIGGRRARKQLGGMSGDISGYMIVSGETAALVTAALTWSFFFPA